MINVDGPPESWAGELAALMVARRRTATQIARMFRAVFFPESTPVNHPVNPSEVAR